MNHPSLLSLTCALVILAGCGDKEQPGWRPTGAAPVGEKRQAATAAAPTLELGSNCGDVGASGCKSGVCFRTGQVRNEGYVCSKSCLADEDCPAHWGCIQVYPSDKGWFCVPPDKNGNLYPKADGGR